MHGLNIFSFYGYIQKSEIAGSYGYSTSLVAQTVKCLQHERPGFNPWVGKIPWRRKWQSTPVLLSGKSRGQRSLVGYSPWGRKESNTTGRLHVHVYGYSIFNFRGTDKPLFQSGCSILQQLHQQYMKIPFLHILCSTCYYSSF